MVVVMVGGGTNPLTLDRQLKIVTTMAGHSVFIEKTAKTAKKQQDPEVAAQQSDKDLPDDQTPRTNHSDQETQARGTSVGVSALRFAPVRGSEVHRGHGTLLISVDWL